MHERLFLVGDIYKLLISRIAGDGELLSSANLSTWTIIRSDLWGLVCCGNAWPSPRVSPNASGSNGAASTSRSSHPASITSTSTSGVPGASSRQVQSYTRAAWCHVVLVGGACGKSYEVFLGDHGKMALFPARPRHGLTALHLPGEQHTRCTAQCLRVPGDKWVLHTVS